MGAKLTNDPKWTKAYIFGLKARGDGGRKAQGRNPNVKPLNAYITLEWMTFLALDDFWGILQNYGPPNARFKVS